MTQDVDVFDESLRAKRVARVGLASASIADKLRVLEQLRERDRTIRRAVIAPGQRPNRDANA